jgi:hypothetical protein
LNTNNNTNLNIISHNNKITATNDNKISISTIQKPIASSSNLNSSISSKFSADTEELLKWLNINHPSVAKKFNEDHIHESSERLLSTSYNNTNFMKITQIWMNKAKTNSMIWLGTLLRKMLRNKSLL